MPPNGRRPASRNRRCRPSPRYGGCHTPHIIDAARGTPPCHRRRRRQSPGRHQNPTALPQRRSRDTRAVARTERASRPFAAQRSVAPPPARAESFGRCTPACPRRPRAAPIHAGSTRMDPGGGRTARCRNSRYGRPAGVLPWQHRRRSSPAAIRGRKTQPPPPASTALRGPSPVITGVRS